MSGNPTTSKTFLVGVLALLLTVMSLLQATGISAQTTGTGAATSPQNAGPASVAFSDSWLYDTRASDSETVFLTHQDLPGTAFIYGQIQDQTIVDAEGAMDEFVGGFFDEFGDQNQQIVASNAIDPATSWRLYAVDQSGIPFGMLITASMANTPGVVILSVLLSPAGSFDLAMTAVQQDITVDGGGTPIQPLAPADLTTALDDPASAQTGAPTPTAGTESGGLQLPPLGTTTTPAADTTPQGSSVMVAGANISYMGDWTYQEASSTPDEIAFFTHDASVGTIFGYVTVADTSGDASVSLQQFNEGFFGSFGATKVQQVTLESLSSGMAYSLYTADQDGLPYVILGYADLTTVPGQLRVQLLVAPVEEFEAMVADVQQSLAVDGVSAFSELDPAQLFAQLGGGTITEPTAQVATAESGVGGLQLPPLGQSTTTPEPTVSAAAESEVVVSGVAIGHADTWSYMEEISTQDEIAFFEFSAVPGALYGYGMVLDSSGDDAVTALVEFNEGFFGSFGATNVQQVAQEALPGGHAFSLHTADQNGMPYVILAYADVVTAPGEFRVQMVMSPAESFDSVVVDVQQSFTVGNVGALSDLDPAQLSSLLTGGGATLSPTAESGTSAGTTQTGTALTVSGDVSQFELQDAQGICDAIGWVAMAPDQLPVTEADINYRSACVGGAVYFAHCGTVAGDEVLSPDPGNVWLRCDVTVRVDGAPLESLSFLDFALVDATGTEHLFDILGYASQPGLVDFPETRVETGETVRGSLIFGVPEGAQGPWVIEISPMSVTGSGEAAGSVVMNGDVQPFDIFGQ